jgi:predicted Zn finger-like uncharacterized protein
MAVIEARCPHCQARFLVPAEQAGKPAKCGRCRKVFTPTAAPPAPAPAPVAPPVRVAAVAPVARPAEPLPARVARDVDDEDERPRRRPRKPAPKAAGVHPGLLVGGGAAAVVLLIGFVALIVYLASPSDPEPVPVPPAGPALVSARPSAPTTPAPEPSPPPTAATPAGEASADAIRRVKSSTVYIRVHSDRGLSSGTGFFAGKEGYIVTNSHVVGFEPGQVEIPRRVQVFLDSGETTQRMFDAPKVRLVALDVENDLALLWVDGRGESKPLPAPLAFGRSSALVETQDVFIFGYPLGENLGLNISVNKSTVSSLRKDRAGAVEIVQVAGGMHPGNSGGPVTDRSGAVIGVSVAVILGTQINFAIPSEITDKFVREQIASGGNLKSGRFPTAPPRRRR